MHGVEELGLLKMDFLGLRNLDVITDTARDHPATPAASTSTSTTSPLDDEPTYELLAPGRLASACSSSRAGRCGRSCARWRPRRFEDVAALVALYRPGPDGGQHAQRLRRPEERPEAGRVPPPRRRGGPRRHLRADDLPGVRDAGRAEVRRLLAGRGRQPPQGLRQEEPGAHREGAGEVRRRVRGHRLRRRARQRAASTSSSRSPTTPSTSRTPTATASSPTRPPTSRRTTRPSTSPRCSPA